MRSAVILSRAVENPRTVTLTLDSSMDACPGQFAMLWLPGLDEKPFSIAGARPLSFTICRVGAFSEALHGLSVGDRLWYRGPFGRGFPLEGGRVLLVGGGYGAAPLHFLARELLAAPAGPGTGRAVQRRVEVAIGARTEADLLFPGRFRKLGVALHLATEDGSAGGAPGLVTDRVGPLLSGGGFDHLYACGPEAMLDAAAALAGKAGVAADLSYEAYMRCGIGICGSCEHSTRLVCLDGPVFRA
jgi:dihydroorotate dehydrogenase electron transfer subunit